MPNVRFRDGFVNLLSGMDGYTSPDLLPSNAYAMGVNVSSRGGKPHTRPKFIDSGITNDLFDTGRFQGARMYRMNDQERIVLGIGGRVLGINLSDFSVIDYSTLAGSTMEATATRFYFKQADKYMIVQDGINKPTIIEEESASIATATQVPVGTSMAYGHGRLFVVVPEVDGVTGLGERFFRAGDIIIPQDPVTVLDFTETVYLTGGAFALPNELGFITGMSFMRNSQSGDGLGPLIVFARNGACAFGVNAIRANWATQDVSNVLFSGAGTGTRSPHSILAVNNDLLYRGKEGLRSVGYTASTISSESASMSNNPFSVEVSPIFDLDDDSDLFFSSLAYANNRVFATANGQTDPDTDEEIFKAIISMDLSAITAYTKSNKPLYDGVWTGLDAMQVLGGVFENRRRLLVVAKQDSENKIFYLDDDAQADEGTSRPVCRVYTRAYRFAEGVSSNLFHLDSAEVWISDIQGTVDFTLYWRPHGYALWSSFSTGTFCANVDEDNGIVAQFRQKLKLTPDADACDSVSKRSLKWGSEFQFCVQWTGHCKIEKLFAYSDKDDDPTILICAEDEECTDLIAGGNNGITLDDYDYTI